MQYDRDSHELAPLAKSIDRYRDGLGAVGAIKQGVYNNYDTDIFQSINQHCASLAGIQYGASQESDVALRGLQTIFAPSHLVADGVTPSNEGRGYVLRRRMTSHPLWRKWT